MLLKDNRCPFHVIITTLLVTTVFTLAALFLWITHRESRAAAIQTADRLFSEVNEKVRERFEGALTSVAVLAGSAARMPGLDRPPVGGGLSHPGLGLMLDALAFYEYLFSTYIGWDDGSFIQVVAVRDDQALNRRFGAPAGTQFALRTIAAGAEGGMTQRWLFLNRERKAFGERVEVEAVYDPRTRPWYTRARREKGAFYTEPYIFSSAKLPGITCAKRLAGAGGVFGADITLDRFSVSLERQKVSESGMLFLFDPNGRIIAHPSRSTVKTLPDGTLAFLTAADTGDPRVLAVVADYRRTPGEIAPRTREMKIGGVDYLVRTKALSESLKFDQVLASIAPAADFSGHIRRMQRNVFL